MTDLFIKCDYYPLTKFIMKHIHNKKKYALQSNMGTKK